VRLFVFAFACPPHIPSIPPPPLQCNDNQISDFRDLDELKNATQLATVYLERNPVQKDPQYRLKVKLALPAVRQIDAAYVRQ